MFAENDVVAGKFRLVRELGRGGMGSVWLAQHTELDIPCAVKFIEGSAVNNPESRARFAREAKAAAQLRSPHVVQILDHGEWNDLPYIAMELLDGEDLAKRLMRMGRLPPTDMVTIFNQAARALGKAHQLGIVHRDLKPDNIYLVRDDDREIVKILDFGIAKMNTNALGGSGASATRTGALMGTPYYMSPEQAQGNKRVDTRSDMWALAVIAYECLTGKRPFDSDGLGDLLLKICAGPVPKLADHWPEAPAGLEEWWAKAAQRDPEARFQNAKEFADAFSVAAGVAVVESPRLSAVGDSAVLSTGISARTNVANMTVSGLSASGAPVTVKGNRVGLYAAVGAAMLALGGIGAYFALHTSPPKVTTVAAPPVVTTPPTPATTTPPAADVAPTIAPIDSAPPPVASIAVAPPPPKVDVKRGGPPATPTSVAKPKKPKDETGF